MSEFSKAFIQTLFILLSKANQGEDLGEDEIEQLASFLDEGMGGVTKTETKVKAESKSSTGDKGDIKYSPDEVPDDKCHFILTRGPNISKCCSLKVVSGTFFCSRHPEDGQKTKSASKSGKTTKVATTEQESVSVAKPGFKFSGLAGRNFKPVGAAEAKTAAVTKPETKGIFAAKSEQKKNVPSFLNRAKANFISREFHEDDGAITTLKYTNDPIAKNLIFMNDEGQLKLVGILDESLSMDENDDNDILSNIDGNDLDTKLTDEQSQWCVRNRVSIN